jgi:hypothetical protein
MGGPARVARVVPEDQRPIAHPLSRPYVARSRPRLVGVRRPPAAPWSNRPAISLPSFGAAPQITEATANPTTPARKTGRRPYRSPNAPPGRYSAASISEYERTIHCSPARPVSKSFSIAGSARFRTVASMNAIEEPAMVAMRMNRRARIDRA